MGSEAFSPEPSVQSSSVATETPVPKTGAWRPRSVSSQNAPAPSGLPRLIWEILSARGVQSEEAIQKWMSPSLKDLKEPLVLTDMGKAVERLLKARETQEPIVIYADYDLDGTSGLALLLKAFEWMGFENVTYYQPKRLTEGYGLRNKAIQGLYNEGRRLILSIDLGITAVEEVEFAKSLGMEVIITDHHLPKETLPEAVAVVNPNRGNCESGLGHLCGTGVAFYLVLALKRALQERGLLKTPFDPKALLDCFVIGTVTDMVPLIDENRVLVKHGLLQLAQTKRPGLRVLMQALSLWGRPLTSQDVAIRFAPKLNALSRMEMGILPIDLYLVEDENEAQLLVERVLSNNQDRQASQKSAEQEAFAQVRAFGLGSSIFAYSQNFHKGVVGLVATKLCQEFGLPAFVGSFDEETGRIVGSARMPDGMGFNALDAMGAATEALEQFGGHAAAAGFELKVENAEAFRAQLDAFFAGLAKSATSTDGGRVAVYDAETTLGELGPTFMTWYETLSPFGVQFTTPVFFVRNLRIAQVKPLKGGHFRLTLADDAGQSRAGLWFSPAKSHALVQAGVNVGQRVDALVEPQWNYFAGQKTLQLLIQDIRPSV